MKPIYDSWDPSYKSVFGALRRNAPCTFTLRLPADVKPDSNPMLILYRIGMKERFIPMNTVQAEDGVIAYSATCSAKYAGVHYYYFSYICNGQWHYIKKSRGHIGVDADGDLFQLTVYDEQFQTPDFLKGGIMYQIFPDRFCKSGKTHENVPADRVIREDWGGTPLYRPDENGHVWNNDYFGGDLEGIRSKLPYLHDLGVTCIYLNPIFEAHENHRYNTADYRRVDPLLGTNEDFRQLCADAKKLGIAVILDGVFSHTGADSVYFNKFNRYDTVGAYNSPSSPYYRWYSFQQYPDVYESWWGITTLPNVNENHPDYTDYICGKGGVLEYWLEMGASGYRLDVADELPDAFLDNLNRCVKGYDSNRIIIGEVWEDASNKEAYGVKRRYLLGDQLDSVMNYPFRSAIMQYLAGMNPEDFRIAITTILENYPKTVVDVLMNFVSTHDIERAITVLGGESYAGKNKDWAAERYLTPEEYERGKLKLQCAMVLQFFLPGVPSVYYGDEASLQGYGDPFNRRCYPWGHEDQTLIAFTKRLGEIRRKHDVFAEGRLRFLNLEQDAIVFARYDMISKEAVVIALNRTDHETTIRMNQGCGPLHMIQGTEQNGCCTLPPYGFAAAETTLL